MPGDIYMRVELPEQVRRRLKADAALSGKTVRQYLIDLVTSAPTTDPRQPAEPARKPEPCRSAS